MGLLITGASGFIGRNFLLSSPQDRQVVAVYCSSSDFPHFLRGNALEHVLPLRIDLSHSEDVDRLARTAGSFDQCLYLAGNGDPAFSVLRPVFDLTSNCAALVNLLERVSFGRFVYFSSGAVYSGLCGEVSPRTPVSPALPYAIAKLASEHYIRHFQKSGRIKEATVVRFFGAYGPYEPPRKVFSRLVHQFAIRKDPHFTIRGDGRNLIDAIYVDDAIRAIHMLLNGSANCSILDLYSGTPLTLTQLVKTAGEIFGVYPEIAYEGNVPEYIEFFSRDDFMVKEYGFAPLVSLREGLVRLRDHLGFAPSGDKKDSAGKMPAIQFGPSDG